MVPGDGAQAGGAAAQLRSMPACGNSIPNQYIQTGDSIACLTARRATWSGGFLHHSMWGAPSPWTPVAGKTCPGRPVRVRQWEQILLPAFLRQEESNDLGTFEGFSGNGRESFEAAVRRAVDVIMSQGLTGDPSGAIRGWAKQLDELHGPAANTADVDARVRDQLRGGFGGVHPDATSNQVRPSQDWIVATLLDIQAKLDQLLGQPPPPPGQAGEPPP